jgi:hypothetical protein
VFDFIVLNRYQMQGSEVKKRTYLQLLSIFYCISFTSYLNQLDCLQFIIVTTLEVAGWHPQFLELRLMVDEIYNFRLFFMDKN